MFLLYLLILCYQFTSLLFLGPFHSALIVILKRS